MPEFAGFLQQQEDLPPVGILTLPRRHIYNSKFFFYVKQFKNAQFSLELWPKKMLNVTALNTERICKNMIRDKNWKKVLFGLGLDNKDEHKRFTKGHNFYLIGGSEDTHKTMQEKSIKFNECLKKLIKTLDDINKKEFYEIADKIGLQIPDDKNKKSKS